MSFFFIRWGVFATFQRSGLANSTSLRGVPCRIAFRITECLHLMLFNDAVHSMSLHDISMVFSDDRTYVCNSLMTSSSVYWYMAAKGWTYVADHRFVLLYYMYPCLYIRPWAHLDYRSQSFARLGSVLVSDVVWDRRSYDKTCLKPKKIGLGLRLGLVHCGLGLGLAVLVLFCETRSCNARRHNDLEGHRNFSSTIYSFSILCLEH